MAATSPDAPKPFAQMRVVAAVFAGLLVVLVGAYFLVLRKEYAVAFDGLRSEEAAAIVAELDRRHISYKLADGGARILVPAGDADGARLAIAGANISESGAEGFELFDESDMGLTDFAQKIRYQRALQGELSRTIMLMDGVEDVRVHISMPERTLFRGERHEPKAAVTLITRSEEYQTPARIEGVQRLVAAAVPDLAAVNVAVLNAHGELISPHLDQAEALNISNDPLVNAVRRALPDRTFEVTSDLIVSPPPQPPPAVTVADAADAAEAVSAPAPPTRLIKVVTDMSLTDQEQSLVRAELSAAGLFAPQAGDGVRFSVGAFSVAPQVIDQAAVQLPPTSVQESDADTSMPASAPSPFAPIYWVWLAGGALALGAIALALRSLSARSALSVEDRSRFAERLKLALAPQHAGGGNDDF